MFQTDLMELADYASLQYGPKGLNGVRMNVTIYIPSLAIDSLMLSEAFQRNIASIFIGHNNTLLNITASADQGTYTLCVQGFLLHYLSLYIAVPLNHPEHRRLVSSPASFMVLIVGIPLS